MSTFLVGVPSFGIVDSHPPTYSKQAQHDNNVIAANNLKNNLGSARSATFSLGSSLAGTYLACSKLLPPKGKHTRRTQLGKLLHEKRL